MAAADPTGTILDYAGSSMFGKPDEPDKQWRKREHEHGVSYICPWEDPFSGFPEHARRCARALNDAGMHVHLRSSDPKEQWFLGDDGGARVAVREKYADLLNASIQNYLVEIHQIVPTDTFLQQLVTHRFIDPAMLEHINKYKIVSTVWERDRISEDAARCLNAVGQCWVANDHDAEMLSRCGVDKSKLRVVRMPYFPDDPHLKLNGRKRLPGPPRFVHIGKWEPRKEHRNMLGAFMMAFKPGAAKFYLKTSSRGPKLEGYPESPDEAIATWFEDARVRANGWELKSVNENIFVIRRKVSTAQIFELHRLADCYVSLSRGEGFGMPDMDSKLAGNLLVYTPSGGPQAFAGELDERVEPTGSIPCHPFYRWGDAHYLDYNVEDAAAALQRAAAKIIDGKRTRGCDLSHFQASVVGKKMRANIEELCG